MLRTRKQLRTVMVGDYAKIKVDFVRKLIDREYFRDRSPAYYIAFNNSRFHPKRIGKPNDTNGKLFKITAADIKYFAVTGSCPFNYGNLTIVGLTVNMRDGSGALTASIRKKKGMITLSIPKDKLVMSSEEEFKNDVICSYHSSHRVDIMAFAKSVMGNG